MVKLLSEPAPAKINLFLRVTGRRPDGYHELDSVVLPISIYDRLTIELRPDRPQAATLRCDAAVVPSDERNLALRAALEFIAAFNIQADVSLCLHKEIPVGAGLGGGSSDAAAVIRMMAALCGVADSQRLAAIALELGADVPFFLDPTPARVGGIGELIQPLRLRTKPCLIVAIPPVEVSTASVYRRLRPAQWSGPASQSEILGIIQGQITQEHLVNDLEKTAVAEFPQIQELRQITEAAGARAASMTGSGSGIFGIFDSMKEAVRASEEVRRRAPDARIFSASVL